MPCAESCNNAIELEVHLRIHARLLLIVSPFVCKLHVPLSKQAPPLPMVVSIMLPSLLSWQPAAMHVAHLPAKDH